VSQPEPRVTEPVAVDVLVLGAGGAGLCAALSAAESGADSVLVLEAAERAGGSTAISAGSFMAAGTTVQAMAGYGADTPAAMIDHLLTASQCDAETGLIRVLCEQSAPTLDWLAGHGVRFPMADLYRAGREPAPRSHRAAGQGRGLVSALLNAAERAGIEIRTGHRASGLLTGKGAVRGAVVGDRRFRARSVVLATGGFARDEELVRRYLGSDVAWPGATAESPSVGTARGDGLRMTEALGGKVSGRGGPVVRLNPSFPAGDLYLPPWLLLVDESGQRFMDESAPPQTFRDVLRARGGRCWAIFDEAGLGAFAAPREGLARGPSWADTIREQIAAGAVAVAPHIEGLAAAIGVPAPALGATVARYEAACGGGRDADYEKAPAHLRPVRIPPFYATELRAHVVLISGYGLEIDPDGAVRRREGGTVPGLFAAGEVTGNTVGARYPGQGIAITTALVFGRISGQTAAVSAARKRGAGPAARPGSPAGVAPHNEAGNEGWPMMLA
jgi:fumarate reductase flavoprotein subunit